MNQNKNNNKNKNNMRTSNTPPMSKSTERPLLTAEEAGISIGTPDEQINQEIAKPVQRSNFKDFSYQKQIEVNTTPKPKLIQRPSYNPDLAKNEVNTTPKPKLIQRPSYNP